MSDAGHDLDFNATFPNMIPEAPGRTLEAFPTMDDLTGRRNTLLRTFQHTTSSLTLKERFAQMKHDVRTYFNYNSRFVYFDVVQTVLAVGSCVLYVYTSYNGQSVLTRALEAALVAYFIMDYSVRMLITTERLHYALSLFGMVDAITIIPVLLRWIIPGSTGLDSLAFIRVFRLLRVLRIMNEFGFFKGTEFSAVAAAINGLVVTFISIMFVFAGLFQLLEDNISFGDAFYYAAVTMTTVGYGDISPKTSLGKALVTGVIFMALVLVPIHTHHIVELIRNTDSGLGRTRHDEKFVILSGLDIDEHEVFDFVQEFFHPNQTMERKIVVVTNKRPTGAMKQLLQHPHYTNRLSYCMASLMDDHVLDLVNAPLAEACFIVPNYGGKADSNRVDKHNLLQATNFRRHTKYNVPTYLALSGTRFRELCRFGVASTSFCLDDMRSRLIAHSLICPGYTTFVINLLTTYAWQGADPMMKRTADRTNATPRQEYYYGLAQGLCEIDCPSQLVGLTFIEAAVLIYAMFDVMPIGYVDEKDKGSATVRMNPGTRRILRKGDRIVAIGMNDHTTKNIHKCNMFPIKSLPTSTASNGANWPADKVSSPKSHSPLTSHHSLTPRPVWREPFGNERMHAQAIATPSNDSHPPLGESPQIVLPDAQAINVESPGSASLELEHGMEPLPLTRADTLEHVNTMQNRSFPSQASVLPTGAAKLRVMTPSEASQVVSRTVSPSGSQSGLRGGFASFRRKSNASPAPHSEVDPTNVFQRKTSAQNLMSHAGPRRGAARFRALHKWRKLAWRLILYLRMFGTSWAIGPRTLTFLPEGFPQGHVIVTGDVQAMARLLSALRSLTIQDPTSAPEIIIALVNEEIPPTDWRKLCRFSEVRVMYGDPTAKCDLVNAGIMTANTLIVLQNPDPEDPADTVTTLTVLAASSCRCLQVHESVDIGPLRSRSSLNKLVVNYPTRVEQPLRLILDMEQPDNVKLLMGISATMDDAGTASKAFCKLLTSPVNSVSKKAVLKQQAETAEVMRRKGLPQHLGASGLCNMSHLRSEFYHAGMIVSDKLLVSLLPRAHHRPLILSAVEQLISGKLHQFSSFVGQIRVPPAFAGKTYLELFYYLALEENAVPIGLYRSVTTERLDAMRHHRQHGSPRVPGPLLAEGETTADRVVGGTFAAAAAAGATTGTTDHPMLYPFVFTNPWQGVKLEETDLVFVIIAGSEDAQESDQ